MKFLISSLLASASLMASAEKPHAHPNEDWPIKFRLPTRREVYNDEEEEFDEVEEPREVHKGKQKLSIEEEIAYYFGTFVSTSPYPGVRATYFGTELMSQLSNVNKDLQILIELESYKNFLRSKGLPYFRHPRMFLSGLIDGNAFVGNAPNGNPESDIDLGAAEIGFLLTVNTWLNSIVVLEYDNDQINLFGDRVENSRIQVQTGLIMFGDLDVSPFYISVGQAFIPFGQYSTYASIETPLTKSLFRILGREIALGFYNKKFQGSVFTFKGGTFQDKGQNINNFGCNLSYLIDGDKLSGKIGAGVIRNIADSRRQLIAFNNIAGSRLKHVVPGAFVNGNFTYGKWDFIIEYLSATKPFSLSDMAYSTNRGKSFKGARPSAVDAELVYNYTLYGRETSLAFGYSQTNQALGFALPRRRILLTSTTNVGKGALLSFEVGMNRLYNKDARASGKVMPGNPSFLNSANLGNTSYFTGVDFVLFW